MPNSGPLMACVMVAATLTGCHSAPTAPRVGFYKLDNQRVSGATVAVFSKSNFAGLSVLVSVDTAGNVISAQAVDNYMKLNPAPGLAVARTWKFRPQRFDGRPVIAVGLITIEYQGPEIPPDPAPKFPTAAPADTEITLERGACFGSCPDYRVTIAGDGAIRFDTGGQHFAGQVAAVHLAYGGNNVLLPGTHTARVSPSVVSRLLQRFQAARFFGLKEEYAASVTDNPTQRLTVRIGAYRKTVTDYVGTQVGMPNAVRDLEKAADQAAGTARWVDGNADTLAYLQQNGFNFRSKAAGQLIAAAAWRLNQYPPSAGTSELISGLIERGAPLDVRMGKTSAGEALVSAAAAAGNDMLFAKLAQLSQLSRISHDALNRMFVHVGCSPSIARALVKAGADPRHAEEDGSALNAVTGVSPNCGEDEARSVGMARTLIELGVPLEARNSIGWTALMGCESPELAKLLLSHGANPNAKDEDGTSAVLSTYDDRVVLILLRAGANPRVRDKDGTLRDAAVSHHMPATLAWLDDHGVQ